MAERKVALLDLPPEVLRLIHLDILHSIDIKPSYALAKSQPQATNPQLYWFSYDDEHTDESGEKFIATTTPIHCIASNEVAELLTYATLLDVGNRVPWESHVRFVFPGMIAMLDVLLSWPVERRGLVRHACIRDTAIYITPTDIFLGLGDMVHARPQVVSDLLPKIDGLRLVTLIYQDSRAMFPSRTTEQTVLDYASNFAKLMTTQGWREMLCCAKNSGFVGMHTKLLRAERDKISTEADGCQTEVSICDAKGFRSHIVYTDDDIIDEEEEERQRKKEENGYEEDEDDKEDDDYEEMRDHHRFYNYAARLLRWDVNDTFERVLVARRDRNAELTYVRREPNSEWDFMGHAVTDGTWHEFRKSGVLIHEGAAAHARVYY